MIIKAQVAWGGRVKRLMEVVFNGVTEEGMMIAKRRGRPVGKRRRPPAPTAARCSEGRSLHRTFYYLQAEQFIRTSVLLIYEAG